MGLIFLLRALKKYGSKLTLVDNMQLFLNKKHKLITLFNSIWVSIAFMKWMPYGSFFPNELGFWLSTVNALMMIFLTNITIIKLRDKSEQSNL